MYQITCPACQQTQTSSFARTGAVTQCRSCGHKFRIDAKNTSKVQMMAPPSKPAADQVLRESQIEQVQKTKALQTIENAREVTGLSGLSQLVEREHQGPVKPKRTQGLQPAQTSLHDQVAQVAEQHQTRKKIKKKKEKRARQRRNRNKNVITLFGVLIVLLIGLMVGAYVFRESFWQVQNKPAEPNTPRENNDGTSPDGLRDHDGNKEFFGV